MARKQYPLRIDPVIWDAVQLWAGDEMRSANAQMEWIVRDALKRAGRLPRTPRRSPGSGQDANRDREVSSGGPEPPKLTTCEP